MRSLFAVLLGRTDEPVGRATYVKAGLSLMLIKYIVDAALIGIFAGVFWTPLDYLLPMIALTGPKVALFPIGLNIALLLWTVPFLCIGVSLSVRRALDARVFPGIVVMFFLPILNYAMMLALSFAPSRRDDDAPSMLGRFAPEYGEDPEVSPAKQAFTASGQMGIITGAATGLIVGGVGVVLLHSYGASVFLGTPFLIGLVSAFVVNRVEDRTKGATILIGQLALVAAGGAILLFAIEGAICLAMAVPIASPVTMLGSYIGYVLAQGSRPSSFSHISLIVMLLFVGSALDAAIPGPSGRIVTTAIEIDASADVVWHHVTSLSDITAPPGWLFKTGLAYPLRARLEGSGVGAVRHCEFTTGAFVEPITEWDAPRRLGFDVVAQPPPLREWSPYTRVYAPHLDGFFRTSHGEFRLQALAGNRTRLEGRTWYDLDMQPARYWTTIADRILHAIHSRVLEHVKTEAERSQRTFPGP